MKFLGSRVRLSFSVSCGWLAVAWMDYIQPTVVLWTESKLQRAKVIRIRTCSKDMCRISIGLER